MPTAAVDVIRKEIVARLDPFRNDPRPLRSLIPEL
jgi:hypothetical protein